MFFIAFILVFCTTSEYYSQTQYYSVMPFDSLQAVSYKYYKKIRVGGQEKETNTIVNTFTVSSMQIPGGSKYFLTKLDTDHWLSLDENQEKKVYRYVDGQVILFADFSVDNGDTVYLRSPDGMFRPYIVNSDYIYFLNENRKRITFNHRLDHGLGYQTDRLIFIEGVGLYSRNSYLLSASNYSQSEISLFSALFENSDYNRINARVDSADSRFDRYLHEYPYKMKVFAVIDSRKEFQDSFYVEYNILRDSIIINSYYFNVDTNNNVFIPDITSSMKENDLVNFRVVYKDSSIFRNTAIYPGTGYVSFKILPYYKSFFSVDSIRAMCIQSVEFNRDGYATTSSENFFNVYSIQDTVINGEKFYLYDFFDKYWISNEDSSNQKVYRYFNGNKYVFANFNSTNDQQIELNHTGFSNIYTVTVDSLFIYDRYWPRIQFTNDTVYGGITTTLNYTWIKGLGFYSVDSSLHNGLILKSKTKKILAAKFNMSDFNRMKVRIDSTNIKDGYLDQFPCTMRIFSDLGNMGAFRDSFYIDYKLIRNGEVAGLFRSDVDSNNNVFIALDSTYLKQGDIFKYKIVYKDTSIFRNSVNYPADDYAAINITPYEPIFYLLLRNYPNPFNPGTSIVYSFAERSRVKLSVFDILGREVTTLVNEELPAGEYITEFNARQYNLSSGLYFCRLTAGKNTRIVKMVLVK